VSGDLWYEMQAFQAVAQAVGRCIRHPRDYGAIVLLDSRWGEHGKLRHLPKWLHTFTEEALDATAAVSSLRAHFAALKASACPEPLSQASSLATRVGNPGAEDSQRLGIIETLVVQVAGRSDALIVAASDFRQTTDDDADHRPELKVVAASGRFGRLKAASSGHSAACIDLG